MVAETQAVWFQGAFTSAMAVEARSGGVEWHRERGDCRCTTAAYLAATSPSDSEDSRMRRTRDQPGVVGVIRGIAAAAPEASVDLPA